MERKVILSVIGPDRPGLTRVIAEAVLAAGGSWVESQLTHMAGRYVGAILVSVAAEGVPRLEDSIRRVDPAGLTISLAPADAEGPAEPPAGRSLRLELVGQDQPGIVREVSTALAELGVNIVALETAVEPTPESGGALFKARANLIVPSHLSDSRLAESLERISAEILVDIDLRGD